MTRTRVGRYMIYKDGYEREWKDRTGRTWTNHEITHFSKTAWKIARRMGDGAVVQQSSFTHSGKRKFNIWIYREK